MVQWKESEKELHLKYQIHDKQGWPTNKLIKVKHRSQLKRQYRILATDKTTLASKSDFVFKSLVLYLGIFFKYHTLYRL